MNDYMGRIVLCKFCGKPEYYGEFRWIDGKMLCRRCYKVDYEAKSGKLYEWNDLDGEVPTMADYIKQE